MEGTTLVQAKVNSEIKEKAERYFNAFGFDSATAIRMFFEKVAETGKMLFTVEIDPEDIYDAKIADEAYEEYIRSGKKSRPFSELLKELDI